MLKSYGRGVLSSLIIDMLDHFKKNSSFIQISFGFDLLFPHYMFSSVQVFYYVFLSACKTTQNINYICFFCFNYFSYFSFTSLTRKNLQSDWLRGVQYWPYLYFVYNICTLSLNKKKNTFEFRGGKIEMYSLEIEM